MFSPLGTPGISATIKYFNDREVPHLFAVSGVSRFSDPKAFPYTVTALANYQVEARIYGKLIAKDRPNSKVAVLYQNDDDKRFNTPGGRGCLVSSDIERLPRLVDMNKAENWSVGSIDWRLRRVMSPPSGSTLMTSAP
jgi:hypothetical protein